MPYRKAAEVEEDTTPRELLNDEIIATKLAMLNTVRAICDRVMASSNTPVVEVGDLLTAARATFECVMNHDDGAPEENEDDDY